jgi:hypothetical protein
VEEELARRRGRKRGAAGRLWSLQHHPQIPQKSRKRPSDVAIDDLIEDDSYEYEDVSDDDLAPPAYVESPPRSRRGSDDLTASTVRVSAAVMTSIFAENTKGSVAAERSRGLGGAKGDVRGHISERREEESLAHQRPGINWRYHRPATPLAAVMGGSVRLEVGG